MNATSKQAQSTKRNGLYCPECNQGPFSKANVLGRHRRTAHGVIGMSASSVDERRRKERLALTQGQTPQGGQAPPVSTPAHNALTVANKANVPTKTQCPECKELIDTSRLNGHRRAQHGVPVIEDLHQCPDCDLAFSVMGLAIHRRAKHGTLGKSNKKYMASLVSKRAVIEPPIPALSMTILPATIPTAEAVTKKGRPSNASKGLTTVKPPKQTKEIVHAGEATAPSPANSAARPTPTRQNNHHPTPEEEGAIAYTVGRLEAECIQQAIRFDLPPKQFTHWCIEHLQRITAR